MTAPDHGPFETADQVRALPVVAYVYKAMRLKEGSKGLMASLTMERILEPACEQAGITLGAHDRHILGWLATFGPEEAAVIAGLITRRPPRTLAIDLSDPDVRHVLTEALEQYAGDERNLAENEGGNDARERWADTADRMRGLVEDAAQGRDAADSEAQS